MATEEPGQRDDGDMRPRPNMSPSCPTWVAVTVITSRYPTITQMIEEIATCTGRSIEGTASTTIVVSMKVMTTPMTKIKITRAGFRHRTEILGLLEDFDHPLQLARSLRDPRQHEAPGDPEATGKGTSSYVRSTVMCRWRVMGPGPPRLVLRVGR